MNDTASFQQLVRRRLDLGAPCCLNPDEIAAVQALFEERDEATQDRFNLLRLVAKIRAAAGDPIGKLMQPELIAQIRETREERERLQEDRDTWRRVAERLEREKIALAQDVLNGRDRYIAQAEVLEAAANDCVPAMHQMAHWLRARADECRRKAKGGAAS